jgi:5-methylcytosine-specific restriction endonuclease McrA
MAWEGSYRRSRLPRDWQSRRARILRRDGYACQHREDDGRRCGRPATDVDHIVPGDNHADTNLRALCRWHHQRKSSAEGAAGRAAKRIPIRRPPETHPADL